MGGALEMAAPGVGPGAGGDQPPATPDQSAGDQPAPDPPAVAPDETERTFSLRAEFETDADAEADSDADSESASEAGDDPLQRVMSGTVR